MYHGLSDLDSLIANGNVSGSALNNRYALPPDYRNDEAAEHRFYQRSINSNNSTRRTDNAMANSALHLGGTGGGAGAGASSGLGVGATNGAGSMASGSGTGAASTNGNSNGAGSSAPLIYPALHLQPLNDTFAPKQISLAPPGPQNKVKIGRQTNNKTIPQPNNGYFDSKVLSRMHAEVWSQDGKVYIKDVKSSNGTFINNTRLSPEGQESEVFELNNDDLVEFGIDIVGDDNKTIIHHKVACRVFLVITAEEALGLRHDFAALYRGGIAGSTLNHHSVGPGAEGGLRRGKLGTMGGYGANGSTNGFVSFDHVIHRLQAELQKSRETAGNLSTLNSAMSDIGETLGGGLAPMQNPPYQHMVPSLNADGSERPGASAASQRESSESEKVRLAELKVLEEKVKETQATLNAHLQRLDGLESRVDEHDRDRGSYLSASKQIEDARREWAEATRQRDTALTSNNMHKLASGQRDAASGAHDGGDDEVDFDDGASMMSVETISPSDAQLANIGKGPVGVDEVESADMLGHMSLGDVAKDDDDERGASSQLKNHVGPLAPADGPAQAADKHARESVESENTRRNEELSKRLEAMEAQLERALDLGRTLAGQHAESTETVKRLEDRIKSLEAEQQRLDSTTVELKGSVEKANSAAEAKEAAASKEVATDLAEGAVAGAAAGGILAMVESKLGTWREAFESDFQKDKTAMQAEREELRRIVLAWDSLNQDIEDIVDGAVPSSSSSIAGDPPKTQNQVQMSNGGASRTKKKKRNKAGGNGMPAAVRTASSSSVPTTNGAGSGSSLIPDDSTVRLNRELRALLYTDDFNLLVRDEHMAGASNVQKASSTLIGTNGEGATGPSVDTLGLGDARSGRSSTSPGQASPASQLHVGRSTSTSKEGRIDGVPSPSTDSASLTESNLSPEELRQGVRKKIMTSMAQRKKKGRGTGGVVPGYDNPATLSALGAAGIVIVGMTAYILSGKGVHLGSGVAGGG